MAGLSKVRQHDRFQFRLDLDRRFRIEIVQIPADGGIVPELHRPGILDRLIFHQRVSPQVQFFQIGTARQGGQPKFEDQVAPRQRILTLATGHGGPQPFAEAQMTGKTPPRNQHSVLGGLIHYKWSGFVC